jgi:uncharacterized membrane protein
MKELWLIGPSKYLTEDISRLRVVENLFIRRVADNVMVAKDLADEKPRRNWVLILTVVAFIGIIVGFVVYVFVLPLIGFEKLELRSYESYYWVAAPEGQVRQLVLEVVNNGTFHISVKNLLVDGTEIDSSGYGGYFGNEVGPTLSTAFYVAPVNTTFLLNHMYNVTLVTSRGNSFSFATEVREDNVKTESVQVGAPLFSSGPPGNSDYVAFNVKVLSGTDAIIKKMWINGTACSINPLWLLSYHTEEAIGVVFGWDPYKNYTVTIETAAGSRFATTGTAIP